MGSSFGRDFCVTTFGESHGSAVGVVVDGCPPRLPLGEADIQHQLDRRRPGQSSITTPRAESDEVKILSGVYAGVTLGTPIALAVGNHDSRGQDYAELHEKFRPSHGDYTYQAKYGVRAVEGGGRASARETVGRVAAGAIARLLLARAGVEVVGWVDRVQDVCAAVDPAAVTVEQVDGNIVRCPDPDAFRAMIERIEAARRDGDSVGAVVGVVARGVPPGWGDPVFDKLDADLAKAMLSIPAAKGFEVGAGFAAVGMTGSQHNDVFVADEEGRIRTRTNHAGGILAGLSSGEAIVCRVAFKPPATILRDQQTVDSKGRAAVLHARGRHDPCVAPRAVPVVEAMMALVLADHMLRHRGQCAPL